MISKAAVGNSGRLKTTLKFAGKHVRRLVATPRRAGILILIIIMCLGVGSSFMQQQAELTTQTQPAASSTHVTSPTPDAISTTSSTSNAGQASTTASTTAADSQSSGTNNSATSATSATKVSQSSETTSGALPSSLLDLSNWRLTLPIASPGTSTAEEISQPQLANFSLSPYFVADTSGGGVLFNAPVDGATTSGSTYPRSELRQMTNSGTQEASWATTAGTHTMTVREAITHLPVAKPQVVSAQIHDASQDVIEILADDTKSNADGSFGLCVRFNGVEQSTCLTDNYQLGTPFTLEMTASNGQILIYYNSTLVLVFNETDSGDYFKAGCYTQSNLSKGDNANAYGEVEIYSLATSDS